MSIASSKASVELDFFGIHKDRPTNLIGISKINPADILKSVINSKDSVSKQDRSGSSPVYTSPPAPPTLPLLIRPNYVCSSAENKSEADAPLTIFYNGTVSVFNNVPRDKVENIIMKLAVGGSSRAGGAMEESAQVTIPVPPRPPQLLDTLGDLPIQRKKSLQIFLQKRKERLTSVSPY